MIPPAEIDSFGFRLSRGGSSCQLPLIGSGSVDLSDELKIISIVPVDEEVDHEAVEVYRNGLGAHVFLEGAELKDILDKCRICKRSSSDLSSDILGQSCIEYHGSLG